MHESARNEAAVVYQETSPLNRRPNGFRAHWKDWLCVQMSAWIFISPWVLNFDGVVDGGRSNAMATAAMTAAWNAWILGAALFILSMRVLLRARATARLMVVALGVWVFFAPWVLGFRLVRAAGWDHWISGAFIAGLSIWST
jgi:hypothetical protein